MLWRVFCTFIYTEKYSHLKIEQLYQYFLKSSGICTDTRKISKGCLFFALKGDNFNGNTFTQEALDKGAFKVVIDDLRHHKNTGETILSGNALKLLQKLALYHRKQLNIPIIAITGSNGKTTTKELIKTVLSEKFNTVATVGNLNNHIGVPLTLLSMDAKTQLGIVEMGANHLKEIDFLCAIALPDYGYITNFGKAHLEGFGSLEGVIKAKTELYNYIKKHNKIVFVNANDKKQMKLSESISRITFGNNKQDFSIQLKNKEDKLVIKYKNTLIESNLIGIYNFDNLAAAVSIGAFFKVQKGDIKSAIENYQPSNNRSQIINKGSNKIILDAYNANPSSLLAALSSFLKSKENHKILFLGDMFELGKETKTEHQNIVNFLEDNYFTYCYLIGENFNKTKTTSKKISKLKTFESLKKVLNDNHFKNSFILIKASRGMALERVLELL